MRAVQVLGDSSSPNLKTTSSAAKPVPKASGFLLRVHSAGITGPELTWPELYATPSRIPGHDISGVVVEVGSAYAGRYKVGDGVYGMLHADGGEGQADFVACTDEEVALKGPGLTHAEAAALPIPLLTAWEVVAERGGIKDGTRVLVTGASGAVGVMFVQLARRLTGAYIVALASGRHHETLRAFGAHETLDYAVPGWENTLRDIEVVFDTVGGEVLSKSWETITDDGTILTIGDPAPAWAFGGSPPAEASRHPNVIYSHFIVSPDTTRLQKGAEMVAEGTLKPIATKSFPFSDAEEAWACAQGRGRGYKVVINFSE